jgi:acetyl-CoA carboxylase carboxyl transferase subunit beta
MSWITRTRQQLTGFLARRDTPDNLWTKCKNCGAMVYTKEWEDNGSVCPRCDHHDRIGPNARFTQLFDGDYRVLPAAKVAEDPLKFKDQKKYTDRLKAARTATGEPEAMMIGDGQIMGQRAIVGVQDFAFMGGSMGMGVGEAFLAGVDAALAAKVPYIVFTAAGGARSSTETAPSEEAGTAAAMGSAGPRVSRRVSVIPLTPENLPRSDSDVTSWRDDLNPA